MTMEDQAMQSLGRGIDYLGMLGTKLRDLLGYETLAHELIQNAEDSEAATSITFDVRANGLVVDNNGAFSDCNSVELPTCPWVDGPRGYMCDFHSFRKVGSGAKRNRPDTVGAFGIGFTAIYQITDRPELISGTRHWFVHEELPETERIKVCPGCDACKGASVPETRFIFPWAFNGDSKLRQLLRADPLGADRPAAVFEELKRSLPTALLFLSRIEVAEIRRDGVPVHRWERCTEPAAVIVSDGRTDSVWYRLCGDFRHQANALRQQHSNRIEPDRSADVTVAIPTDPIESGLFCAFLPTQQQTGLPFHINADFFPTSDRKHIVLESDYQSQWNRAAIEAAAKAVNAGIDQLRGRLGHRRFWELIEAMRQTAEDVRHDRQEKTLICFWQQTAPTLRSAPVIYTTAGDWTTAEAALLLETKEEEASLALLEGLGLKIVHSDLRFAWDTLRCKDISVQLLDASHLASALQRANVTGCLRRDQLPDCLKPAPAIKELWSELAILLGRKQSPADRERVRNALGKCSIARCRDGSFWPCAQANVADDETAELFESIAPEIPFLASTSGHLDVARQLCPSFSASVAISFLAGRTATEITEALAAGRIRPASLIDWFAGRTDEVIGNNGTKEALKALPIFPSAGGLRPLAELSLPGGYRDELSLANLVDMDQLDGRRDFLGKLGVEKLTFETYVREHVPRALQQENLPLNRRRATMQLLAQGLGGIRDLDDVHDALCAAPVVECRDGQFRRPVEAYFESESLHEVLGDGVHTALVDGQHANAVRELYRWLGVASLPRVPAILDRVRTITSAPPTDGAVTAIRNILSHLGSRLEQDANLLRAETALWKHPWLPARGRRDCWYHPGKLHAAFNAYLFESQANFLDVPNPVQQANTALLTFLGVKDTPEVSQVVSHLLYCAETGIAVSPGIYEFLNNKIGDPSLSLLKDANCLFLRASNRFVKPSTVFWREHPFGNLRYQLAADLERYRPLLKDLGVRDDPEPTDALQVIAEIEAEYGNNGRVLDEAVQTVLLNSWKLLESALDNDRISGDELKRLSTSRVICNGANVLNRPEWMFFDDRAGLAAKFDSRLQTNVIDRPLGAWHAMSEAGVRSLSSAARAQLLERDDPVEDCSLRELFLNRKSQLQRILDVHSSGFVARLDRLADLKIAAVKRLRVGFQVRLMDLEIRTNPEDVPAHCHRDNQTLYFVRRGTQPPWGAIARELADFLCPEVEPGQLAPGIKAVLAANTLDDARLELDELGFSRLEDSPPSEVAAPILVTDLGTALNSTEVQSPPLSGPNETPVVPPAPPLAAVDDAIRLMLGRQGDGVTALPNELDRPDPVHRPTVDVSSGSRTPMPDGENGGPWVERPRSGDGRPRPRSGRRGFEILRSYVMADRPGAELPTDDDAQSTRDATGQAGVDAVMEFERIRGRFPREMPPKHPGYDVESSNSEGAVERYIEVKSVSGEWVGADLLSPTGSIYVHIGPNLNHLVRCIIDEVLGMDRHLNEIIWRRAFAHSDSRRCGIIHDAILLYSKSDRWTWNEVRQAPDPEYVETFFDCYDEKVGKKYQRITLTAPGITKEGPSGKPWRGVDPSAIGRHWAKSHEELDRLDHEGRIHWPKKGVPRLKRYEDEYEGMVIQDTWTDLNKIHNQSAEATGYNTQKPTGPLDRIIRASSKEGDLVADFFCGSGTAMVVAETLGRRWIGCDLGKWGVHVSRKRLLAMQGCRPFEVLNLGRYERQYWQGITFASDHDRTVTEQTLYEYLAFILRLYAAQPVPGLSHLHGKKGRAMVHIGAVDAPVTIDEISQAIDECVRLKQPELHVLGWEWEMGLAGPNNEYRKGGLMQDQAKLKGIKLLLLQIPREVMEQQAVDKGDIDFFELAYLDVEFKQKKKLTAEVKLNDFVIPNTELIPDDVRKLVRKWSDYIDYWAIDWDFRNDTFMQGWVTYRTRQDRTLLLSSDPHTYEKPGKYRVLIKVIDIFGNDTSQAHTVEVK